MKKRLLLCRLICLLVVIGLSGAMAFSAKGSGNDADVSDIISLMYTVAANDFSSESQDAALAETAFADNWSVILAGGGSAAVKTASDGNFVQFDKYSSVELKNVFFGPDEAYAVSYTGKFGEKGHNYLFVRGSQVLKRNGTTMNWYETDGSGAGSGVGGSGISFRVYNDHQIQVSVKSFDAEKDRHVNTKAVLIDAYAEGEGTLASDYHTFTCYDNGKGSVRFYVDGEVKAVISYSNVTTYDDALETAPGNVDVPIHAQYYKDVVVSDADGEEKLTVTDALAAVNGRVAFGHRNVSGTCYKAISVYSESLKVLATGMKKYGSGNLGLLTGGESTKRCFPTMDTFVYFRNSGGMAVDLGTIDLSKYDRVAITWWDAACGNARTLTPESVNFALTSTGSLDTTDNKQVEREGINKLAFWSLDEAKEVGAKDDFRTAETIILPLDTDYSGNVYLAYMGNTNAIAFSQITFYEKTEAVEPTENATTEPETTTEPEPTTAPEATTEPVVTEETEATPTNEPAQTTEPTNPGTGDTPVVFAFVLVVLIVAAFAIVVYRLKKEEY